MSARRSLLGGEDDNASFSEYHDHFPTDFTQSFTQPRNARHAADPFDFASLAIDETVTEEDAHTGSRRAPVVGMSQSMPLSLSSQSQSQPSARRHSQSHAETMHALSAGMTVIKLDRRGLVARKSLYLRQDSDGQFTVTWDTKKANAAKSTMLLSQCRLEAGYNQGYFAKLRHREKSKIKPSHCFSLLGAKRSLDIVCPSTKDADQWIATLASLMPSIDELPPVEGRLLRVISGFGFSAGIAISPITGEAYVTDRERHSVSVIGRGGEIAAHFGSRGTGDGQFDSPTNIAIDSDGSLFVADTENSRISVLDIRGKVIEQWNDNTTETLTSVTGLSDTPKSRPTAVAIDNDSNEIMIGDDSLHRIQCYSLSGEFVRYIGNSHSHYTASQCHDGDLLRIGGIVAVPTIEGTRIYVSDVSNHRVQVFDSEGKFLKSFGARGIKHGQFQHPHGLCYDNVHSLLFVADTDNHRVQCFTLAGNYVSMIGREGSEDGDFNGPVGLALCPLTGYLYVSDSANGRVQVFY